MAHQRSLSSPRRTTYSTAAAQRSACLARRRHSRYRVSGKCVDWTLFSTQYQSHEDSVFVRYLVVTYDSGRTSAETGRLFHCHFGCPVLSWVNSAVIEAADRARVRKAGMTEAAAGGRYPIPATRHSSVHHVHLPRLDSVSSCRARVSGAPKVPTGANGAIFEFRAAAAATLHCRGQGYPVPTFR